MSEGPARKQTRVMKEELKVMQRIERMLAHLSPGEIDRVGEWVGKLAIEMAHEKYRAAHVEDLDAPADSEEERFALSAG